MRPEGEITINNVPMPINEAERLKALHSYAVLDTPPEAAFERITSLAARLFKVPVVLVSLIDETRQWWKSCYGMDTRETGRELAFCAHAILSNDVMVVPDAHTDMRFAQNPLVTGPPHIRFYAGAPLQTPDGFNIGTLCVIDTKPRNFSVDEQAMLSDLAAMVVDELELRVATRKNSQFALAIQNASIGVVITNPGLPDNPITSINPAFSAITGYTEQETLGRNCRFLQGPATSESTLHQLREALANCQAYRGTLLNYRKDGSLFWNELSISPVLNDRGEVENFVGLQTDVTERIVAEAELRHARDELELRVKMRTRDLSEANTTLKNEIAERRRVEQKLRESQEQLRGLAARLEAAQEEERTRIAREIHDELGQLLTSLKLELSALERQLPSPEKGSSTAPDLHNRMEAISQQLDASIQSVRKIATELRPEVLNRFGLKAAIEWQTQAFQKRAGIRCSFAAPSNELEANEQQSTALFRILQEALTNVARHAGATRVEVRLQQRNGHLTLEVKDNGRGVILDDLSQTNSLGVVGMRERALLLGGKFEIKAKPGKAKGTVVRVSLPLGETFA